MLEKEMTPEIQREALLDQKLKKEPVFEDPFDLENYRSLSENKGVALAGLLLTIGVLVSPEAKAEFYYNRPENVKPSETQILENFTQGDENTVYRYGTELQGLVEKQPEQQTATTEAGEQGRAIIKQLSRIMMFCEKHGVKLEDIYDISKVRPDLLKAAQQEFSENLVLGQDKKKPLAKGDFERTRPEDEALRRRSR